MATRRNPLWIPLGILLAVLWTAAPAEAERPLELGITGFDGLFSDPDPAVHDLWLDRATDAGAGTVLLPANWASIAPSSKGAGFDPANPADPHYSWDTLDSGVRNATAHGLDVIILVNTAPAWAEGPGRPPVDGDHPDGTWKPDPKEYATFATAITTRYGGGFVDPTNAVSGPLPAVHLWQVWAEPNLWVNLTPQYVGKKAYAADQYRRLVNAFYDAAKAVSGQNTIIAGGLAPYGDDPSSEEDVRRTRPLAFFREMLCLRGRKALEAVDCGQKPKLDVLADNPINLSGGPRRSAIDPDDVTSADLSHVTKTLRAAEREHTIRPKGKHPLWATEFWFNSEPPYQGASPPQRQARWIEESMYLFWKAGASMAIYLHMLDGGNPEEGVSGTGLYFKDGDPKPALTAFRFPFVTERKSRSEIRAWGRSPAAGKVRIERKKGKGWRKMDSERVAARDVFTANLRVRGKAKLRASIAGQHSLPWLQKANDQPSYRSDDPLSVISPRAAPRGIAPLLP
jgi:hypothetical protein